MLRVERKTGFVQRRGDAALYRAQGAHGGEETERAAARCHEQFAIGGGDLVDLAPVHVLHHENARLIAIAERRAEARALRRFGKMIGAGAHLRALPVLGIGGVAQGGRRDERAMRVAEHFARERMVGSTQWRSRPTSRSRPSSRSSMNQSMNSSLTSPVSNASSICIQAREK